VITEHSTTHQMCSYTTLWFIVNQVCFREVVACFVTLVFHKVMWRRVWVVVWYSTSHHFTANKLLSLPA